MGEPKRSNFSVTCNRLSQYLKKTRSFADPGLYRPPTTLNLLPGIDISAENQTYTEDAFLVSDRNATNPQLTLFYGGKMMVFDNIRPEKAADLINLATVGSSSAKIETPEIPMPLQRRASLHRFIEKRKDRINSKGPYQMKSSSKIMSTSRSQEARSWLGLGREV
ncbi:uncharacterized protein A4U43_C08F26550 [Asparagus officinalis]|uniref:protein TIFY 10c-like n=1 Tax=Asparagus officinalis TaxID=4686 RepID=UPI00098DF800|nr:protein TIFY 10c-like [Asparagus officinalis]ONK61130.1 uncharacterized protein A4U43_C08F26550 [Asparagus officinalis]